MPTIFAPSFLAKSTAPRIALADNSEPSVGTRILLIICVLLFRPNATQGQECDDACRASIGSFFIHAAPGDSLQGTGCERQTQARRNRHSRAVTRARESRAPAGSSADWLIRVDRGDTKFGHTNAPVGIHRLPRKSVMPPHPIPHFGEQRISIDMR